MTDPTSPDPRWTPSRGTRSQRQSIQNSDDNIADQTKASALNNEADDPASERSDYELETNAAMT